MSHPLLAAAGLSTGTIFIVMATGPSHGLSASRYERAAFTLFQGKPSDAWVLMFRSVSGEGGLKCAVARRPSSLERPQHVRQQLRGAFGPPRRVGQLVDRNVALDEVALADHGHPGEGGDAPREECVAQNLGLEECSGAEGDGRPVVLLGERVED